MKPKELTVGKKLWFAILSGWLGLLLSQLSITGGDTYHINIIWSLIFPLMIAIAWDIEYAVITAAAGLTIFIPFYINPDRGYANIITTLLLLVLFLIIGLFMDTSEDGDYIKSYFMLFFFGVIYVCINLAVYQNILSWNPEGYAIEHVIQDQSILIESSNFILTVFMLCTIGRVLLSLSEIRKIYGLESSCNNKENWKAFLVTVTLLVVYFILNAVIGKNEEEAYLINVIMPQGIVKPVILITMAFLLCDIKIQTGLSRQAAGRKLELSEKNYALIFKNIIDTYLEIASDGLIAIASPSAESIFHENAQYLIGKRLEQYVENQHNLDIMMELLTRTGEIHNFELDIHTEGHERVNLLVEGRMKAIGQTHRMVLFLRDMTEFKKTQEELVHLNQELEREVKIKTEHLQAMYEELKTFSHQLAHEFKTPLREIDALCQFVLEDQPFLKQSSSAGDMSEIQKISRETVKMADELMEYAKIGYAVINQERVDMESIVRKAFESYQMLYPDKKMKLRMSALPPIYVDEFLIRSAVMNIIGNSVKFSMKREEIEITVTFENNQSKTRNYMFADNGVGFDEQYADKVGTLFERLHSHKEYEGSGIGFAIVKKIMESHGGTARISGKKNLGCLVTLSFPTMLFY